MLRITSPNDVNFQSFQVEPDRSQGQPEHKSYCVSTPSKTSKKQIRQQGSVKMNKSSATVSQSTSILKQVIRKDHEIEDLRNNNSKYLEKLNDLEYLLDKAAEEVRIKNEETQQKDLKLAQLKMDLHQALQRTQQLETNSQKNYTSDPQFRQVWDRGMQLEQENEMMKEQIQSLEIDANEKINIITQLQTLIDKIQQEFNKATDDYQLQTKKLKKLKSKNKTLLANNQEAENKIKSLKSLKQENDNLREDLKEILKEKIEQERTLKKLQQPSEVQTIQQYKSQLSQLQSKLRAEEQIKLQLENKIMMLEATKDDDISLQNYNQQIQQIEGDLTKYIQQINQKSLEADDLRKKMQEKEVLYQNQIQDLNQELQRYRYFEQQLRSDQDLNIFQTAQQSKDLTFTRSQSTFPKSLPNSQNIPLLTLRTSMDDGEIQFEGSSKVHSSRINSQRHRVKKSQIISTMYNPKVGYTENGSTYDPFTEQINWVSSLSASQLQEELCKALEREMEFRNIMNILHRKTINQTSKQAKTSVEQLQILSSAHEDLNATLVGLNETIWVEKSKNQLLMEIINDLTTQGRQIKQNFQEQAKFMSSIAQSSESQLNLDWIQFKSETCLQDLQDCEKCIEEATYIARRKYHKTIETLRREQSEIRERTSNEKENNFKKLKLGSDLQIEEINLRNKYQLEKLTLEHRTTLQLASDRFETTIQQLQSEQQHLQQNYEQEINILEDKIHQLEDQLHVFRQQDVLNSNQYEKAFQFKVRFLNFLNSSVVTVISKDPSCCESLIRDNHEIQISLNWLLEAGKQENEYLKDDNLIFQHAENLWGELILKCMSQRSQQNLHQFDSNQLQNQTNLSSFLQSDMQIQSYHESPQKNYCVLPSQCSIPELQEILDLYMRVICNLLSAITTISSAQRVNQLVPSPQNNNSYEALLGHDWLKSIRPSLDQTAQLVKNMAPTYYQTQQMDIDQHIQTALSCLTQLNKNISDLPSNFFTQLTMQNNSVTNCITKFTHQLNKLRTTETYHKDDNIYTAILEINEKIKSYASHDPMMMFTYFLTEISAHFKRPDIVKNITTTLIVNLHRLEMQNSQIQQQNEYQRKNSERKSVSKNSSASKFLTTTNNNFQILEELATFLTQLSINTSQ